VRPEGLGKLKRRNYSHNWVWIPGPSATVEAAKSPGLSVAGRIRSIENNSFTSSGLDPTTFGDL
jgi:hypothetical protein